MYYNTTNQQGKELKNNIKKALTQYDEIKKYFRNHKRMFTPSEIWVKLYDISTPITSVRRAITDLTNDGVLEKTKRQKPKGLYNRPEYYWRLKQD